MTLLLFGEPGIMFPICAPLPFLFSCVYVHVCVKRGAHVCRVLKLMPSVFYHHLPYSLRQSLSPNLELPDLARLADQQAPEILLSLPPQCCDWLLVCYHTWLSQTLGHQTRDLILTQWGFYQQSHFLNTHPSPAFLYYSFGSMLSLFSIWN